ncbi:MAG: TonB family protein [Novosphingobium sp.]|nr:TonB family protein [Novosphingobium sp.]MCP5401263.1 TonB family protein [Novosphingobium sp.]
MTRADLRAPPRLKLGVVVLVAVLHLLAVLALIRAFAPEFTGMVADRVVAAFTVEVSSPEPSPTPEPKPAEPDRSGAAAPAAKKATPKEVAAPEPKIDIAQLDAPKVAATGDDVSSGARDRGEGTGAGGQGAGTGSGDSGTGQGAGGGSKVEKIAGDINSARDYPRESRDLRIGDYVIVALTVGTDGRVKSCRVHRASRDPEADRITCELATKRFRFRPATDANGNPVESVYGWKQRWFYPGKK